MTIHPDKLKDMERFAEVELRRRSYLSTVIFGLCDQFRVSLKEAIQVAKQVKKNLRGK